MAIEEGWSQSVSLMIWSTQAHATSFTSQTLRRPFFHCSMVECELILNAYAEDRRSVDHSWEEWGLGQVFSRMYYSFQATILSSSISDSKNSSPGSSGWRCLSRSEHVGYDPHSSPIRRYQRALYGLKIPGYTSTALRRIGFAVVVSLAVDINPSAVAYQSIFGAPIYVEGLDVVANS